MLQLYTDLPALSARHKQSTTRRLIFDQTMVDVRLESTGGLYTCGDFSASIIRCAAPIQFSIQIIDVGSLSRASPRIAIIIHHVDYLSR